MSYVIGRIWFLSSSDQFIVLSSVKLLTLNVHARPGYSNLLVCRSVFYMSVCPTLILKISDMR